MNHAEFFERLSKGVLGAAVTDAWGERLLLDGSLVAARKWFREAHNAGHKVILVGNGGSGAIASHMAIDYTKNGGIRSVALNDHPTLTCIANDFGYDQVFSKQIEFYAAAQDVAVIVSTSGLSPNIIAAAHAARSKACRLVTLSGMRPENELRKLGALNFYVSSDDYGVVEISHLSLLHSIVSCNVPNS